MTRIEIPIKAITVENDKLEIDKFEIMRAQLSTAHIIFITEQPDNTTVIYMADGYELECELSYSQVKELLADTQKGNIITGQGKPIGSGSNGC